ncbi:glycosyltransferase family 4 protein [Leeia sp.]|uniref:glycosyltransferase family 4 protein n=1 Tax=Leeia sp. TaxID=2884678 RepID=UPI0035B2CD58
MKIALIRQKYSPFGGAERFVSRALSALSQQGLEVTLLSRNWDQASEGTQVKRLNPFYLGRTWRDWSFARAVSRWLGRHRFDLVQSHERIAGCEVYRAGDGVHRVWLRQKARRESLLLRWLGRLNPYHHYVCRAEQRMFHHPRLRAVICNSKMVQQELIEHFQLPLDKLHVIYSGVDPARFHPGVRQQRAAIRQQWGIPEAATVYLFLGSGFQRKGVAPLLQALVGLPESAWVLVVGKDKQQRQYQRLARRLGIADRVVFAGGQTEVAAYYGAADVFVLPTLYDAFPNAALEAMACGLPLLTSPNCGAAELIRNGDNGYVCDALDVETLHKHMHTLLDAALSQRMGAHAQQTVAHLTPDFMATQMVALYRQLLQPNVA